MGKLNSRISLFGMLVASTMTTGCASIVTGQNQALSKHEHPQATHWQVLIAN